jgi:DNA-binding GntR family transcriptional regulator
MAHRSTAKDVVDALRERILRGKLAQGERLPQDKLAQQFKVSQMILREAFQRLTAEGFLIFEPRRGVRVAPISAEEAWEITQLRGLLEAQALEWAIPRLTQADLAEAADILDALDATRSTSLIIALNGRFHDLLYAPCGQPRTLALIANLRLTFERYLRFTWEETGHLAQSQREHRAILEACGAGNIPGGCVLLREHIVATGTLLIERLKTRKAG